MSNPLLEPIHGVSLYDYAAISAKIASGASEKEVCQLLGIEPAIYEEASARWIGRMQEDNSFEITTLFGQYFGEADQHPKLGNIQTEVSEEGKANLDKLKNDRYFYEELNGARQAAYAYGYDGAQWIFEKFGINLGDFQSVAIKWSDVQQKEFERGEYATTKHFLDYQQKKQEQYADRFATEQADNVADDIEF
ncbi:DUF6620 family protein [Sphingobacterium sp. LRF_L2]|uniref:DUF6620 family protein n=1 Tax=Sphingobacterium sp. LRF_L2 TaxID=3369421 RepID=UPI003F5D6DD7